MRTTRAAAAPLAAAALFGWLVTMTGAVNGPDRHGDHRRAAPEMIGGWQNPANKDVANP
jgi:hypothetical protein